MPGVDQLPADLAALAGLNALDLSPTRFDADADRLVDTIEPLVAAENRNLFGKVPPSLVAVLFSGGAAVIVLLALWYVTRDPVVEPTTTHGASPSTTATTPTTMAPGTTAPGGEGAESTTTSEDPTTTDPSEDTVPPVTMPQPGAIDIAALEADGFEVIQLSKPSSTVAAQSVIWSDPVAGSELEPDQAVMLAVSSGPHSDLLNTIAAAGAANVAYTENVTDPAIFDGAAFDVSVVSEILSYLIDESWRPDSDGIPIDINLLTPTDAFKTRADIHLAAGHGETVAETAQWSNPYSTTRRIGGSCDNNAWSDTRAAINALYATGVIFELYEKAYGQRAPFSAADVLPTRGRFELVPCMLVDGG